MVTAITTLSMVTVGFCMTSATVLYGACEYANYRQKKEEKEKSNQGKKAKESNFEKLKELWRVAD